MNTLSIALIGSLGSALQEVLHWHELRYTLHKDKYSELLRSAPYWTIVSIMVVASGLVTLVWFSGDQTPELRTCLVFGFSLPLILKKARKAAVVGQESTLGKGRGESSPYWG